MSYFAIIKIFFKERNKYNPAGLRALRPGLPQPRPAVPVQGGFRDAGAPWLTVGPHASNLAMS